PPPHTPPPPSLFPYTTLFRSSLRGEERRTALCVQAARAGGRTPSHALLLRAVLQGALSDLRDGQGRRRRRLEQPDRPGRTRPGRSEEHTSELQSRSDLVCRLL